MVESRGDAELTDRAQRVVAAIVAADGAALRKVRTELRRARGECAADSFEAGVCDGLLAAVEAAAATSGAPGLAPQAAPFEPGSLPARMLLEIAAGVQGANSDLAERLDTDAWQVSRAGRRLRDLGLASRSRSGRLNGWTLTATGEREVARLRGRRTECG